MFDKLRSSFSGLVKTVKERSLTTKEVDEMLWNFQISMMESDVAQEVAEELSAGLRPCLLDETVKRTSDPTVLVRQKMSEALSKIFKQAESIDLFSRIEEKKKMKEPYVILFLGINGTGKTTTVAKFAFLLKNRGISVVMACSDTHRPGAIEQLTQHAANVSVRAISQQYGSDPAAVARDAILYAKSHNIDVVLIDTAGRMQTSHNLMEEISKIVKVSKPDLKLFVGDALAWNDSVSQAKEFLKFTDFDGAILTKVDADSKGGAALSISHATKKPILFLGVGQQYEDLEPFSPEKVISMVFN